MTLIKHWHLLSSHLLEKPSLLDTKQHFPHQTQRPGWVGVSDLAYGGMRAGSDHMTSLTAGRRGSPPACLSQAEHGTMPSLLSLAHGNIYSRSRHMPPLSFPWHIAEISNQTQCSTTTKLFAHLTPRLAGPHGSTGQMLEERSGAFNSIFYPSKTGHFHCLSPITTHGRHC